MGKHPTWRCHDVYARRVSGTGQILTWFAVSAGPHNRTNPSVAYDPTHDRYLVTWAYDYSGNGSDIDVRGRYISWNGGSMSSEFVIAGSSAKEMKPKVVYGLASDEFLVVWMKAFSGSASSIAGAFLHNDGTLLYIPISSGTADHDFPDVAYNLARNEYLVTWDVDNSGTGLDVYAVRLNAAGDVLTPGEFAVANTSVNEQHPTVAACRQADQYLVVWQQQNGTTTDDDLWGRFMTGEISLSPSQFVEGTTAPQRSPDLTCNWAGTEYFAAWHDMYADPNSRWGIWAKQIETDHSMKSSFEVVAPSDTGDRTFPAVAGGKNSYLVAWQHQRDGFSHLDIWGEVFMFLPAPTNVQASDGTYTSKVLVSWNAPSGATAYKVYRATSATGTKTLLGSPTVTSFNDTSATPGVQYYYWVVAYNGTIHSAYSAPNSGWRKLSPPTNVQASDGTYTTKVLVNWNASSGATSYKVYRATSSSGTKTLLGSPTGTTYNDTSATPGVTYRYWVVAYRGTNFSGYSVSDTGWRKLSPPTNLKASDGTYTTKVLVSWTASSGATFYKVYRAASATGSKTLLGSPKSTTFNDTSATPGDIYYYWVVAYRGTRYSAYSAPNSGWRKK